MNTKLHVNHGTVEIKKEILMKDIKGVVADADDLLKEVASFTADEFAAARTKIEERLDEARSRLDDTRIAITGKTRNAADATQKYIRENPMKSIGIAAAGIIIGFLLSRR